MKKEQTPTANFTSLQQAIEYFADPQRAHDMAVSVRWPNGVCCPRCGDTAVTYLAKYFRWQCKGCKGKQFTVKVGTLMEDSPLPLKTWLVAVWLISNAKNGISSCEVARALGVTQKSAWFLLHRIRLAMQQGSFDKIAGSVECDETWVGGMDKNRHKNKKRSGGKSGKHAHEMVMGILERGTEDKPSQMRAKVMPDTQLQSLRAEVQANVEAGSKVFTDGHVAYRKLSPEFKHQWVDHLVEYVRGEVHTNGCENFWSLFARMFGGTYTHIDPRHLQSYVDEEVSRFNNRKDTDRGRFLSTARGLEGKRLTYAELKERGLSFE